MQFTRATIGLLLAPVVLYFALFYVLPIGQLLAMSVWDRGWSPRPLVELFQHAEYARVVVNTITIALVTTGVTVVLAFPVAYYLTQQRGMWLAIGMLFVVFPLLTSVLVRSFAWIVLLGRQGVVNEALIGWGLIDQPLAILYNRLGVYIGLVHVMLPMAVLPLYSVMKGIDARLMSAAASLGAGAVDSFLRVFLPLSAPGVIAAALLVFIGASGAYITPLLLGGPRDVMVGGLIGTLIEESLNWRLAAAYASALFAVSLVVLRFYHQATRPRAGRRSAA